MNALILDAGALIAVDRGDRATVARVAAARAAGDRLRTNPMAVAQVWRDGSRQATLARLLQGVEVRRVDDATGRAAGRLLGSARASDAIDASVVLLARAGDRIMTSDPDDLARLAEAAGLAVRIVPC